MRTFYVVIYLIYAFIVKLESPRVRGRDVAIREPEITRLDSMSSSVVAANNLILICPMPVRGWWWRIYFPRLELACRCITRNRISLGFVERVAIVIFRVVT